MQPKLEGRFSDGRDSVSWTGESISLGETLFRYRVSGGEISYQSRGDSVSGDTLFRDTGISFETLHVRPTCTSHVTCYLILSYIILSYPILSYPILSYPILSYPILSYPILSYPILSYPILSYLILSYLILSYLILSYLILSYLILKDLI